ncbi:RNA pseudouridine synthase [Vespertiliibacter pulmonis]|uniref:tRNA pseudouridine32 synthase/23S rRNA pseudouridine746 synthase n=1 Tax=Vespertiliibacter pulmonis TaxID=1443036 RepID=A0A3N4W8E7_9PAST|nr:TIGR01621 family pseudouridine synthase [Vespertiliibacter pulmonis]QLB21403.1 RNA pseudouridine synthase [Vespertiliibacter pulmonis]RPE85817.1 tRNA pseudouridine32 synthase/23S rRNA pseudouridine746 synthase [Vespertiliibacter pulmonis]
MNNEFSVVYRHSDFVIIDKPAGVSVHRDEQAVGLTEKVANQLGVEKVWLVHRLDKITSGLLILALSKTAAVYFYELFEQHQIQKIYLALAIQKPKKKQGKIIGDMVRTRNGAWKLCQSRVQPAITQFISYSLEPNLRLFILQPKTGKTHQLRVAMKSLGSPILGDMLYGGKLVDRVYLHAYKLIFNYGSEQIIVERFPKMGEMWHKISEIALDQIL